MEDQNKNFAEGTLVKDEQGIWKVWEQGAWRDAPDVAAWDEPVVAEPLPAVVPPAPLVVSKQPAPSRLSPPPVIEAPAATPLDSYAATILKELSSLKLAGDLRERLKQAVLLRLRDVRDTVDTREHLRKPVDQGGLGLTEEAADAAIGIMMKYAAEAQHAPRSGNVVGNAEPLPVTNPAALRPLPSSVKTAAPEPESRPSVVVPLAPARGSMTDVRSKPVAVGPIDELRLFTVVDFRRLDPDPRRAAKRLREKVKLLEDESYDTMVQGIRAWRVSPLYQLYVAMGQEGLASGKSVTQIIADRKASNQPVLSDEELTAIIELNRQLRF